MKDRINEYLVKSKLDLDCLNLKAETIEKIVDILHFCKKNKKTLFICGNGGSSANASHLTNDLQKISGLRTICLTDNIPLLTAWSNDESFANAMEEQLKVLWNGGDVLMVLSGSGSSKNIIVASNWALRNDCSQIIGIIGKTGGTMKEYEDEKNVTILHIDTDMQHSEDIQLVIGHLFSLLLRDYDKN
jgi:D-sedoheptulose 7-phosphate isomerase